MGFIQILGPRIIERIGPDFHVTTAKISVSVGHSSLVCQVYILWMSIHNFLFSYNFQLLITFDIIKLRLDN